MEVVDGLFPSHGRVCMDRPQTHLYFRLLLILFFVFFFECLYDRPLVHEAFKTFSLGS